MRYRLVLLCCICLILVLASVTPGLARVVYNFTMDADPGWTATGGWHYGPGATSFSCVSGGAAGANVYGYSVSGLGCGYPPSSTGTLTTTALDCSNLTGVTLGFWRQLGLADDTTYNNDNASLQVSSDGVNWSTVWSTASAGWDSCDCGWSYQQYDISDYADLQPTVYVRWTMGPTDANCDCKGFNIDDVQISADAPEISLWVAYCPWSDSTTDTEFWDIANLFFDNLPNCDLLWVTSATDAVSLRNDLQGKQVFVIPEQELADSATLTAAGTEFAAVLQDFVYGGGTVIVSSEIPGRSGFLSATGLMQATPAGYYWSGEPLTVDQPSHVLASGVSAPTASNSTATYWVFPDTNVVISGPDGNAVVAERPYGAGATVLLGYDYYTPYDTNANAVLLNAVRYPGSQKVALLYENGSQQHTAKRALNRLRTPIYAADRASFGTALGYLFSAVAVDDPLSQPADGWGPLTAYVTRSSPAPTVNVPVPSLISTWGLDGSNSGADTLTTACGATSTGALLSVPYLYSWTSGNLFSLPDSVPSPIDSWADNWYRDADPLTVTGVNALALAGFDGATEVASKAAIVLGNCDTSLLNGFLWDESDQDADGDRILDVEELVTNQLAMLLRVPTPSFIVDTPELTAGGTVHFANQACGPDAANTWCYIWYPENLDSYVFNDTCPPTGNGTSYSYSKVGFYFPVLFAKNGSGVRRATLATPIAVGFPDAGPGFWAFRPIIACYDAGIVTGYASGLYLPDLQVNRGQMAAYISRALAGGDANVPAPVGPQSFPDVDPSFTFYRHVEYAVAHNVVKGYGDGLYHPDYGVNRGQMAIFIGRAYAPESMRPDLTGYMPPVTPDFSDVANGTGIYPFVEYCFENGLVKGYSDGTYQPSWAVNRGQMAVFVQRAFGLETYAP